MPVPSQNAASHALGVSRNKLLGEFAWAVAQSVLHRFSGWDNQLKMLMITVLRIIFNPLLYRLSYRAKERDCSLKSKPLHAALVDRHEGNDPKTWAVRNGQ